MIGLDKERITKLNISITLTAVFREVDAGINQKISVEFVSVRCC